MNNVNLIGYLGKDFEVGTTNSGRVYAKNSLAITKRWKNEIGTSQDLLNFGEVVRISKTTNPKNGKLVNRKMPMYNLTRDGFSLLAMGFTGKKALQFKIAFINAFNEMEKLLQKEIKSPNKYLTDLMELIYPNLPQNDYKVSVTITNNPYSKEAKNVFSLNYLVDNRTPKDPKKLQ
ncbi:Rha family transcriptional regulator [Campylobacter jejuni]|nr:single-stranded DNA-binding protein [Campylobacter coli]EJM0171835.1 Rha family transcriptional regulator [Campylobacter jejuni]EIX6092726.1 Rha family transcriptional regulator [Campylobacter coli]EJU5931967.1 Rha family transcriptional regulator [Campylobacter jejuni]EJX0909564.1 Rha family transcriptional regulator [Campylobacter coli]